VGAERVIDGLFMSVVLFVALQFSHRLDPLPNRIGELPVPARIVPGAAYSALGLFAAAFTVMGVFYWRRAFARRMTERVVGVVSRRLASWLAERVENVADGLSFLPNARHLVPFLAATATYWLANAAASWLLAWGSGFESMTYPEACVTMGVLALGILLPNAPGFFGAFQISIYAGLAMFFSPEQVVGPGAAYVLVIYLCQLGITFVAGALVHEGSKRCRARGRAGSFRRRAALGPSCTGQGRSRIRLHQAANLQRGTSLRARRPRLRSRREGPGRRLHPVPVRAAGAA
jgi:hypothetical protein